MTSRNSDCGPTDTCIWCGGEREPLYRMSGHATLQCRGCRTASVAHLPSAQELQRFYSRFAFATDKTNLRLYQTAAMTGWLREFGFAPGSRMLDVGGGGGFMARMFQDVCSGESHYIDLDPEACRFAREELGLRHVVNGDVCDLSGDPGVSYSFIYCRHVLEHLRDPLEMLRRLIALLNADGLIELILPNGASLEYLGYPRLLRHRVEAIVRSNPGLSGAAVWRAFWTGRIAHGLDPIRHVWALTPVGLGSWLARQSGVSFSLCTKPLNDPVYSVYHAGRHERSWPDRMHSFTVNNTLGRVRGGCHLVARIRRTCCDGEPQPDRRVTRSRCAA